MVKNRLKEIRMKEYMMKQKDFAEFLQISVFQYNRYENQAMQPTLEIALKISEILNKNVMEIFYLMKE